jgi:DNA invertase Pin-like site-specific DNA recombinase
MQIGYARFSTADRTVALQCDALIAAGYDQIFTDEGISGSVIARRGLDRALASLGPGDTFVVWKLDRSLQHPVNLVAELGARGISFRSLSDGIDTSSAGGQLVLHILRALAEFERSLVVERTQAGIKAAKRRGVHLGRPNRLERSQVEHARTLIEGGESPCTVARGMRVGKSALYRALKFEPVQMVTSRPRRAALGASHG